MFYVHLQKNKMNITDWLGFIGVACILIAYLLSEIGKISNKQLTFILLNLVGSSIACLASALINYIPFVVLEAAWALVSLVSFINYFKVKKTAS